MDVVELVDDVVDEDVELEVAADVEAASETVVLASPVDDVGWVVVDGSGREVVVASESGRPAETLRAGVNGTSPTCRSAELRAAQATPVAAKATNSQTSRNPNRRILIVFTRSKQRNLNRTSRAPPGRVRAGRPVLPCPSMAAILLIEDDPDIRRLVADTLSGGGHQVDTADTAMSGLKAVVDSHPDLVILDLGLPDLDGLELLQMIRAVSRVPVIAATARGEDEDIVATLDAGADDYLVKPFSVDQLEARLRAVLRRVEGEEPLASSRWVPSASSWTAVE